MADDLEDDDASFEEDEEAFEPTVTVAIAGLSLYTRHGVSDAERELGQRLVFDIEFELTQCDAMVTDRVEDTVDYGEVCEQVALAAQERSYRTLERLCAAIADRLTERTTPSRSGSRRPSPSHRSRCPWTRSRSRCCGRPDRALPRQRGRLPVSGSSSRSVIGPTGAGSSRGRSSSCCTGAGVGGTRGVDGDCGVTGAVWAGGAGLSFDGAVGVVPGAGVPAGVRVPGFPGVCVCGLPTGVFARAGGAPGPPWAAGDPPPDPAAASGAGAASAATGAWAAELSPEPPAAGTDCSTAGSDGPPATWPSELSPPKPAPAARSTAAPAHRGSQRGHARGLRGLPSPVLVDSTGSW